MTYVLGVVSGLSAVQAIFSWLAGSKLGMPGGKRDAVIGGIMAVVCGLLAFL